MKKTDFNFLFCVEYRYENFLRNRFTYYFIYLLLLILLLHRNEDQRGQGSCVWENPPKNGFNFRPCSNGWCSDVAGFHKRNGTLRFTRCDPRYILVEGSDGDTCVNGQWTSGGHQCIRKFIRLILNVTNTRADFEVLSIVVIFVNLVSLSIYILSSYRLSWRLLRTKEYSSKKKGIKQSNNFIKFFFIISCYFSKFFPKHNSDE